MQAKSLQSRLHSQGRDSAKSDVCNSKLIFSERAQRTSAKIKADTKKLRSAAGKERNKRAKRNQEYYISSNYTLQTAHDQLSPSSVASALRLTAEAASGKQDSSEITNLSSLTKQMPSMLR